jgi:lysophospholipase L1-like esterase
MLKKLLHFTLILCLTISVITTGCTEIEADDREIPQFEEKSVDESTPIIEPEPEPEPLYYIALGDSVAVGFGVLEELRYTNLLFHEMQNTGFANRYRNMAINGYTTSMLLSLLNRQNESSLSTFQQASIITINIGGNNILQPLLAYLSNIDDIGEILNEAFLVLNEVRDSFDMAMEFANETMEMIDNFSIADILRLSSFIQRASDVKDDLAVTYNEVNELRLLELLDLVQGQFPDTLITELESGLKTFEEEFIQIIDWLTAHAPNAIIIVNTVYNPLPGEIGDFTLQLSDVIDIYIQAMNRSISFGSRTGKYLVSDIYSRFNDESNIIDLMNSYLDMSAMILNFDFIHPNEVGHNIISEMNFRLIP